MPLAFSPVSFWYGRQQSFGRPGRAQRWLNILGTTLEPFVARASFRLNDGPSQPLTLGPDRHRLAEPGAFNVELPWELCREGENKLALTVEAQDGRRHTEHMGFTVHPPQQWPLPYRFDARAIGRVQEQVQLIDGHWRPVAGGLRTAFPSYDRIVAVGDASWRDYEALVSCTLHGFIPPEDGPPTYHVSHFGLALRWCGHTADGRQPSRQWFPLGAQGEYILKPDPEHTHWRILFGETTQLPSPVSAAPTPHHLDVPLLVRARVQGLDGDSRYAFKIWPAAQPEPLQWQIAGTKVHDLPGGALALVPHCSDATLHWLEVAPLSSATC